MKLKNAINALSALAHEGRLTIFRTLVRAGPEGMAAGDVAAASGSAFTTASAQLAVLARAGLVTNEREGRSIIYRADYGQMRDLIGFLVEDCCAGRPEILQPLASLATACCTPSEGEKK
ncbi:MAG: metalloregulator ArsR/SmtB family transcription factor [Pseudomonadota bacterium]